MGVARSPGQIGRESAFGEAPQLGTSERIYARLLRAYPRPFRARYEHEMVLLFGDQLRDARAGHGVGGATVTWFRTVRDLASSAIGEHLRKDRTIAQSLATFEPTRTMRLLGLIGLIGGITLLGPFVAFTPFDSANNLRLTLFWLGGAAVTLALYPRLALVRPRLAWAVTAAVVFTAFWNVVWMALSPGVSSPFSGTYGAIGFVATHLGWLSAAAFGAAVLLARAAWANLGRAWRVVTMLAGLALLVGSTVTNVGDDHLGLVNSAPYGWIWSTIALSGLFLNGAGWVALGGVLLLGRRGGRPTA